MCEGGAVTEQPWLSFAGLLRQLRGEVKLTQGELAQAAGLSPRAVSALLTRLRCHAGMTAVR